MQKANVADLFRRYKYEFSGADLESVLIRAKFLSAMNNHVFVTKGDLEETVQDFMPPAYPHEIELQNLVAVQECTSRALLPEAFAVVREASKVRKPLWDGITSPDADAYAFVQQLVVHGRLRRLYFMGL